MSNTKNKSENAFSKLDSNPGWVVHTYEVGKKLWGIIEIG